MEPVAVVEAAIDDLIEDRVALERLEEVANMCFFFLISGLGIVI